MKTKFSELEIIPCATCGKEDRMKASDIVAPSFVSIRIECVRCNNSFVTNRDEDTWDKAITLWNNLMIDEAKKKGV